MAVWFWQNPAIQLLIMTRARDPKQFCPSPLEEPWKRIHGRIIEEESGSRIWEASGRHLGGILEASQEHLGRILEAKVATGGWRAYCETEWCPSAAEVPSYCNFVPCFWKWHQLWQHIYSNLSWAAAHQEWGRPQGHLAIPWEPLQRDMFVGKWEACAYTTPARTPKQYFVSLHTAGRCEVCCYFLASCHYKNVIFFLVHPFLVKSKKVPWRTSQTKSTLQVPNRHSHIYIYIYITYTIYTHNIYNII